jgi:hypothetical protein
MEKEPLAIATDRTPAGSVLSDKAIATDTASVTSIIPTVVLRGKEYLPTFGGDPDEDPEAFMAEVREFFAAPQNASLLERVKVRLAHRQLQGRATNTNEFFLTRYRCISDLEERLREEFGADANFAEVYEELRRVTLRWEEPVEVIFARKTALYRRLFPDASEARLVKELINQMPPQACDPGRPVPTAGGGSQARRQGSSLVFAAHQEAGKLAQERQQISVAIRASILSDN